MNIIHIDFRQMHPLCVFQDVDKVLSGCGMIAGVMQRFDEMRFIAALA